MADFERGKALLYIGIDLGGTKVSALVLDNDGQERARRRYATPISYDQTLTVLAAAVAELEAASGSTDLPVGLGLPGVVDPGAGLVRAVNLPWLAARPFGADLARRLGRPVPLANDAKCFALSEAVDGAGAGAAVVFGAVLGTGVGGAIVVDGRCVTGAHGLAGEWGHTPMPWPELEGGPVMMCPCGQKGCVETILSGRGLIKIFTDLGGSAETAIEVAEKAGAGDAIAMRSLERYFSALARALGFVLNFLDPDVIVLGGGLSELPGIVEMVSQFWCGVSLVAQPRTRLVKARYGADSGVRGAAWLARQGAGGVLRRSC